MRHFMSIIATALLMHSILAKASDRPVSFGQLVPNLANDQKQIWTSPPRAVEAGATEQVRTRSLAALAFTSCAFVGWPISETIHDLSNDWRTARGSRRANLVGEVVSMSRGLTVDDASWEGIGKRH